MSQNKEKEIIGAISRSIKNGEKIYWICPLIEESPDFQDPSLQGAKDQDPSLQGAKDQDPSLRASEAGAAISSGNDDYLSNATHRFEQFQRLFGKEKVGLIHGKMKEKEKTQIMERFAQSGQEGQDGVKILVATTVIEVGIDVKDATIIVIENCEQFGLSQLHQLRGRVGRDQKQSYCILLYGKKFGANGKKRMAIMKQSNDGFFIAEEDLKLRGSGEMVGTRQSGLPEYKIANLEFDLDLFLPAKRNAQLILSRNVNENLPVKNLLKVFKLDEYLRLIFGG
jgi:ATP-dependent DNA helicase RecG